LSVLTTAAAFASPGSLAKATMASPIASLRAAPARWKNTRVVSLNSCGNSWSRTFSKASLIAYIALSRTGCELCPPGFVATSV
jgi:hypothetical protein